MNQIKHLKGKIVVTGGKLDLNKKDIQNNLKTYSFLNTAQQEKIMNRSKFLIIRAGYTTLMEIVELDKKAILIPSPGQTEQEYLADYSKKNKYFYSVNQNKINLKEDIEKSKRFNGFKSSWKTKESVKKFMELINS